MSGGWEQSTFGVVDLDALVADGVVVEGEARLPGDESIRLQRQMSGYAFRLSSLVGLLFHFIISFVACCTPIDSSCMT